MKIHQLLFLALLAMPGMLMAQQIELVKDFNKTPTNALDYIREQAVANNVLFLLGGEGANGLQLWKSDGTNEGTFRLADNYQIESSDPTYLTSAGSFVCFRMTYQGENWLFRSNGTNEGTYPIHKLSNSNPTFWGIGSVNGTMYFSGAPEANGRQLWKTDGTVAGTVLVKDFGISTENETAPEQFFNFNGKLSFVIHNVENIDLNAVLWQSDGTEAGTVPGPTLTRGFIQPAVMGNYIYFPEGASLKRTDGQTITTVKNGFIWLREPLVAGQTIYFSANQEGSSEELWKSDGTEEGTVLVKDIYPGTEDSDPTAFVNVAGTLFFKAQLFGRWHLWKSDGTEQGTVSVGGVTVNPYTYVGQNDLVAVGNQVVFPGGSTPSSIWKSDGTTQGTQLLASFNEVEVQGRVGNEVFFTGTTDGNTQLYKTNLTVAGTKVITDIHATASSFPQQLTDVNGTAFFITSSSGTGFGFELWKSNGTENGTIKLKDRSGEFEYRSPKLLTNVNGILYFVVNDNELWKSDGTVAGTVQVVIYEEPNYGGTINELIVADGILYFVRSNNIWKTDGTTEGTVPVRGVGTRGFSSSVTGLTNINGTLFFAANDFDPDTMYLWKTNGTPEGTVQLRSFEQNYRFSPVVFKDELYFGAWDGINSVELWKSDGTVQGTKVVGQVTSGLGTLLYQPGGIVVMGDYLYYITNDVNGFPLVRTDGTASGTTVIKNLFPGVQVTGARLYTAMGLIYFTVHNLDTNQELLWKTDGTEAGTIQLGAFDTYGPQEYYGPNPPIRIKTELNGKLLFVPFDKETGDRLWVTDGTANGTKMLITTAPDVVNFTISPTVKFGNLFYFPMYSVDTGKELWQSDGTEEGTHITTELNPDGNAIFRELVVVGNTLFMSADDGLSGTELYKYLPSAQDDVVISPIADAFVRNVPFERTNFGTMPELGVKAGSLPGYERKTYLKFPLGIAGNIASAKLRIYGFNYQNNENVTLAASGVENDSWTETGITWQNAPSGSGHILDSVQVNNQSKYYEMDVTEFVRTQLNGDKTASFILTNPNNENIRLLFNSRENEANPPQLVIITETSPAARMAALNVPEKAPASASVIYPNPMRDRFSILVSNLHKSSAKLFLTYPDGRTMQLDPAKLRKNASSVEVDISSLKLPAGKYLLHVQSETKQEVFHVLVSN